MKNNSNKVKLANIDVTVAHVLQIFGSSRNLVAGVQDVGFLRHGLLRPVSEKRMPGKRKLVGHQPHHWRAIDRNIPSQVASPHCLSPFFPATSNVSERSRNAKLLDAGAHA